MSTKEQSAAQLANLQAKGQGDSIAAKNIQKNLGANSSTPTTPTTPPPTYINNPDGSPVNPTPPPETNTPTPIQPTSTIPTTSTGGNPIGQMKTSNAVSPTTAADTSSDQTIAADNTKIAVSKSEFASQQGVTKELNQMDSQQLATKTSNAIANQKEAQAIQEDQIVQKNANELEYQRQVQADTEANVAALKIQQDSENVANQAAAAELKAKNDGAEWEMKTQNEIASQQSNIAFAKLGLSFSGAAINTAQNIYTSGVYNLAKLKTSNAKNYADLQVKINSVAFSHTMAVNKIITDAHEKEFNSKERLRDFIGKAQTNILNSKEDSQTAIQNAINTYKSERQAREDKLYSDMQRASDDVISATKDIQKTVSVEEENAKKKIDMLINNGQWGSLSPQQQIDMEARAGVPAGTSTNTIVAKTTVALSDGLKAIVGKAVNVPPTILAKMHTEVQRALALNIPMVTAVKNAIAKYSSQIPDIQAIKAAAASKAALDASKVALNNASAAAKTKTADATMIKAQKATSGGRGGGGGRGGASVKLQKTTFTVDGKAVQGYFNPSTGKYADSDGNLATGATPYVKPSATSEWVEAAKSLSGFKNTN